MAETETIPRHKVKVFETPKTAYDELYLSVYIQGPAWEEKMFAEMFTKARCFRATKIDDADLVVFTGGPDVSPSLYGAKAHPSVHSQPERDKEDLKAWKKCFEEGIPVFGVCRGMQFLWVANGGKLFQDVDNHQGDHWIYDEIGKKAVSKVSSVHHQMVDINSMTPKDKFEVVATSMKATRRALGPNSYVDGPLRDAEAIFIRDTCFFGVQGHPEYRTYEEFLRWTLKKMVHYYAENPDIVNVKRSGHSVWRLRSEILDNREQKTWDQYLTTEGVL